MKVKDVLKEIYELLDFITEYYPNTNEEADSDISNKLYEISNDIDK